MPPGCCTPVSYTHLGLDRLIKASYALLGLISYLTAGKQEVRAWTITKGTKAPQADVYKRQGQVAGFDLQHCQVGIRIRADQLCRIGIAVFQDYCDASRILNHMGIGDDITISLSLIHILVRSIRTSEGVSNRGGSVLP